VRAGLDIVVVGMPVRVVVVLFLVAVDFFIQMLQVVAVVAELQDQVIVVDQAEVLAEVVVLDAAG
jgi:hypothetical protein